MLLVCLNNLIEYWISDDKKSGYMKFSNGFIEQWGFISLENTTLPNDYYTIKFPFKFVTFPSISIEVYSNDIEKPNCQAFSGTEVMKILFFKETHFLYDYHGIYWSARGIWKY